MASIFATHETPTGSGTRTPQSSSPDTSALSLQSSFRVDTSFAQQTPEREKHPKGKRKRTTSRDKSILESAYNANPKPDKAARLDIVQRVSLNEKEVQIWFQNRRQNDRRKSRPLSPQEIAALRYGSGVPIGSTSTSYQPDSQRFDGEDEDISALDRSCPSSQDASSPTTLTRPQTSGYAGPEAATMPQSPGQGAVVLPTVNSTAATEPLAQPKPASDAAVCPSSRWHTSQSFSTPSSAERHGDESFRFDSSFSSTTSATGGSPASVLPPPSSSSSQFRLSLSLEGKAELVSSQLSPPRPSASQGPADSETSLGHTPSNRTLQRSRSALSGITLPPISTLTAHLPPKMSRGRSRDVHAWESCCEADTRDELTFQAENESSGSAVAAITLLRSSSSSNSLNSLVNSSTGSPSNVLQSNPAKRNAPPSKPSARGGMTKKPKLTRVNSSIARLPSQESSTGSGVLSVVEKAKPAENLSTEVEEELQKSNKPQKSSLAVILSPSGDSDKENWSPDAEGNPHHRLGRRTFPPQSGPPAPPQSPSKVTTSSQGSPVVADFDSTIANSRRTGRVLGDNRHHRNALGPTKPSLLANRANTAPVPTQKRLQRGGKHAGGDPASLAIFEDGDETSAQSENKYEGRKRGDGDEVERFMSGGQISPSKKPDMDCIAGLLSLSQGNWR